jgi:hypothetical protein
MLYQQKPYEDQSVGTLADLMLRSNQLRNDQQTRLAAIAANLQINRAQAQAGGVAAQGQAWGNTLGSLVNMATNLAAAKAAQRPTQPPAPQPAPPAGASGGGGVGASWASAGLTVPPRASMTMTPADPAGALYGAWGPR